MALTSSNSKLPENIGHYKILRSIGKGGMGEVLLAFDPVCGRNVALKRIRTDLKNYKVLKNRFLREAKITAQLTHPGIISIFSIYEEGDHFYYTMPFIEGETLRQILRKGSLSIPALLPIFRSICQTIAYAHCKGIIHRDIKPENIQIGKFGEVVILDWGLAQYIDEPQEANEEVDVKENHPDLTHPGKIVGTLAFMAPERALGAPASIQTDIYSLGVILYQILTLQVPFIRASLKDFRKSHAYEKYIPPEELAPYRDVPPRLSRIVKECLDADPKARYQKTEELIHDIQCHMEGRSEWFESARLNINKKEDWEFQENVLISKHIAITRTTEAAAWVSIMLSKLSFSENIRIETKVLIKDKGEGLGFLLNVPETVEREHPLEGYCLWLGAEEDSFSQLFRNTVEVMHLPDLFMKKHQWHTLLIEKTGNNIHFSLDGIKRFTYLSYLPLVGTHVGIISRDADFEMEDIVVSIGSQNLQVSCLSIPDAFLSTKDYRRALAEYRRIGYSFPGQAEGREALFRAGITLLEQAKSLKDEKQALLYYSLALDEFGKLHNTPGAPLEYLGKSLVYQEMKDKTEEIKCLELALRRYHKHPLIEAIKEQIVYRMHESSQNDRHSAYQLILITLRNLEEVADSVDARKLFRHLVTHWEELPFFENPIDPSSFACEQDKKEQLLNKIYFSIPIAFWLAAPYSLLEIYGETVLLNPLDPPVLGNLFYALFEMGCINLANKLMQQVIETKANHSPEVQEDLQEMLSLLEPIAACHQESLEVGIRKYQSLQREGVGLREFRTLSYLIQQALMKDREDLVFVLTNPLYQFPLSLEDKVYLDAYRIWAYLKQEDWKSAGEIFETYSLELLNQETTLLHSLYGCWLYATEGEEIAHIHFSGVLDTPFPRSWALLGHELANHISSNPAWFDSSFMWERRQLYRQLILYYQCAENPEREAHYRNLERQEYVHLLETT